MKLGFKWSANAVMLGVAIVAGIAAFWWSQRFLSSSAAAARERYERRFEMHSVLVARSDLEPGTPLSVDNLARRDMPRGYLPSGTFDAAELERVVGRRLLLPLRAGDPLARHALEAPQAPSLAQRLAFGARALTVPVDQVSSQANLVRPGDRVDLLLAEEHSHGDDRCVVVRPLLEAVHVLATGQATRDRIDPDALRGAAPSAYEESYSTMTFDVTPQQAQTLAAALRLGELIPTLRGLDDAAPSGLAERREGQGRCEPARPLPRTASATRRVMPVDLIVGGTEPVRISRLWVSDVNSGEGL